MSKVIGIDLGTTNSCVAVVEDNKPIVITNKEGYRIMPSVVAFSPDGERFVGDEARRQAVANPKNTFFSIKREMGKNVRKKVHTKSYSPQELSAIILEKLKKDAEEFLGEKVTNVVITVPAYFDDAQRQATKDAGEIAGLNVLRIINEPTAAALAYGLEHTESQKVLVYDLGGGTFDVSVMNIDDHVIEVLATAGDSHLGGDDFSERLVDYFVNRFKEDMRINLAKDATAIYRVREAAERAKKELSSSQQAEVYLPFIASNKKKAPVHMKYTITRQKFNELTEDLVERTVIPVERALKDAGLRKSDVDKILLVGGSTRIIAVQEKVYQLMGKEPFCSLNPDECVVLGAAIQAEKLSGQVDKNSAVSQLILMDVMPLSLSVEMVGGVARKLIERNTPIPTRHSQIFTTANNFQTSVDIKVFQGERQFTRDNKFLGNFRLTGITCTEAGVPQIEVTFDVDADGIVNVSAKDKATGKEQGITLTSTMNLTAKEIERAKEEAQIYASQDKERKEWIGLRKEAQYMLTQADKIYKEHKKSMDILARKKLKNQMKEIQRTLVGFTSDKMNMEKAMRLQERTQYLKDFLEEVF